MGSSRGLIERRLQNCRIHMNSWIPDAVDFIYLITLLDAQILFSFIFTVELTVRFVVEISVAKWNLPYSIKGSALCISKSHTLGDYPCSEILLQCVVLLAFLHHLTMCCFGWSLYLSYWTRKWTSRFCYQPHVFQHEAAYGVCEGSLATESCISLDEEAVRTNRDGKRLCACWNDRNVFDLLIVAASIAATQEEPF